jgi:hypothetical protein
VISVLFGFISEHIIQRTIWKQDGADSLNPADEHPQLFRVPHVVTQLVELLEVAVHTRKADAGGAALESIKLAEETSGKGLEKE